MRLLPLRLLPLLLLIGAGLVHATVGDVDTLMERSGVDDALRGFQETLGATLARQDPDNLSPQQLTSLGEKAGIAFAPGFLRQAIHDDLQAGLSTADRAAVLDWLAGRLGRKVSRLESREEITARLRNVSAPPTVSPARARLLQRLLKAGNFADIMVDIQYRLVEAMLRGMAADNPDKVARIEPMLTALRERRPQELAHVQASLAQDFRTVYQPLSDAELRRYVRFNESPLGTRYNRAVMHAFNSSLLEGAVSFGQLVAQP